MDGNVLQENEKVKPEFPNQKLESMFKKKNDETGSIAPFRHSTFEFDSDFGFWISGFRSDRSPRSTVK
jgi:hypothetical protein